MNNYRTSTIGETDPELEFIQDAAAPAVPPVSPTAESVNYIFQQTRPGDDGPYYVISVGEMIPTIEDSVGFARIEPCEITAIKTIMPWVDKRYLENPSGMQRESIDPLTRRPDGFVEAQYAIRANHNRDGLIEKYGPGGPSDFALVELTAFATREARRIGLPLFNRKIAPVALSLGRVPDDLRDEVSRVGALAVRERFVKEAREFFAGKAFLEQADAELQRTYLSAIDQILEGFVAYRRLAKAYMDKQDHAVRLPPDNAKSKDDYDERDRTIQWLLARPGVDATSVLSRTVDATVRPVEVKIDASQMTQSPVPQTQCENCGAFANLLADGKPPKMCGACREPFADEAKLPASVNKPQKPAGSKTGRS